MKKSEWNDAQIEQLLHQLPPIKDSRKAEDIYQSIQLKSQNRKQPRTWMAPVLASAVALLLVALISPYFINQLMNGNGSQQQESASLSEEAKMDKGSSEESSLMADESSEVEPKMELALSQQTFVTKQEESQGIVTIAFADKVDQNVIPISVQGDATQNKVEQIQNLIPTIDFKKLGLESNLLKDFDFNVSKENPNDIIVTYSGEGSITSSTQDLILQTVINETFRWQEFKVAKLYTKNQAGIDFGNTGYKESLPIKKEQQKAFFLYQLNNETAKLLAPSPNSYDSINEAIQQMTKGIPEQSLKPSVVPNISISNVVEDGEELQISFDSDVQFENSEPYILMLEAILLTAKEFGIKRVSFQGINISQIGNIDVTKPVDVPYSPNPYIP
ncbi:GerMN domain-containing protein [Metabacillus herbersteinensis]|uniref:GerMN domain-containing protein n=1 Tax=Metabacillus herbersteinensis TaxID=283816 RepID=A0ABV6GD08_9BACI